MRTMTIDQFLNEDQIKEAIDLKKAKAICAKIIEPNLDAINKMLGQENNAMYLSYAVEYAVSKIGGNSDRVD